MRKTAMTADMPVIRSLSDTSEAAIVSKFAGLLIGTAVGDALGLAREGLSPRRAFRIWGGAPLRYGLLFGRGMISDDTEHCCMTAQALLAAPCNVEAFSRELGWRLRWWLIALPAGIGWATLRSIVKLWCGFSPVRSGVYSAGNGPAMRSAVIGACFSFDDDRLAAVACAATRITHSDPRALDGALAIAMAGQHAIREASDSLDPMRIIERIRYRMISPEFRQRLDRISYHLARKSTPSEVVDDFGLQHGVSGYVLDTVPIALFCWLRWPGDVRMAIEQSILLGGDTDSVAAIVGALAGATNGVQSIPSEWQSRLIEWPRSRQWMHALAERLMRQFHPTGRAEAVGPQPLFWIGLIPRNLLFAVVVVLHGLRRLFPPY